MDGHGQKRKVEKKRMKAIKQEEIKDGFCSIKRLMAMEELW